MLIHQEILRAERRSNRSEGEAKVVAASGHPLLPECRAMATKGLTECWRDASAAKPSTWKLMGVACGPREADRRYAAPTNGARGLGVRTVSDWRAVDPVHTTR